jgi:acetolactate synthase small subunit
MTILENVLKDNKEFVENFEGEEMSHHAAKKLAILTCMDCRLIDFFEPALGLKRGDAKIVDVTEETLIIEITGDMEKTNAFISLLKGYGIKKISRTGLTAMARGV